MSHYDAVADLPLTVESVSLRRRARDTSSGFERVSTTFRLRGGGELGRGEDVTYDAEDHDALFESVDDAGGASDGAAAGTASDAPADRPAAVDFTGVLEGEWTFDGFSAHLDGVDLFPTRDPERETARPYRRWAVESAALDLALRQADTHLGAAVGRERDPVNFVASTRLGDPPTADRVTTLTERVPGIGFKLDPTADWTDEVVAALPGDRVRILDFKGLYEGTEVDQAPDADFYERMLRAFPDAVVEDPGLTDETRPLFDGEADRVSWDYPVTGVESVESLPFEPRWLNVKPSRFGTVAALFDTLEWADDRGVSLYGGGQFELGVGRSQLHLLASLFYPDGPNDVAPGAYNDPVVPERLPAPPLAPAAAPRGLEF
ncbi:hypothetical protein [Candidatus Halobonum tyrrellensis]|uniref:Enolase n=1 Tax=Candidatus Halobonum tyrrellensis G22 TaxID=1324957 RepID=V4HE56_9EURY|nr:hypothetical protein [Candidatus Halobonum tyrrellensis]ESP88955.1 hypothetical protein K933_06713 [Candidatus Halobonum tyrrellensis G22]